MKLYGYWRSSASYRVRIALALKELEYEYCPVHLLKSGGEQKSSEYVRLNPAKLVPTLELTDPNTGDRLVLNQSLAIIEYLDARFPSHRLIPEDPARAAVVRTLALDMAADLQPIANLRVLQYLTGELGQPDETKVTWITHWVEQAFTAFEARLQHTAGSFCVGDTVSLADVCLIPQVYNAKRFNVDLSAYPRLLTVTEALEALPAFIAAKPENQIDANS
ncbi:maleylacetoacetate isomerase [Aliidiomarina iranensis]|uniref:Maleylacetoacetate isomerase n=1 Tax=Aliidiomarina iranensis TaxID=1434071 RepID=A0A432W0D4_9GAMM|nr:maleylacetoacetate isomerase [Aliidiomarina iranensis]RUO22476.1 maleylacetoacetate isomerase [Aliidiomarina iranensis]